MGTIYGLGLVHSEVEIIITLTRADLNAVIAPGAVAVNVSRSGQKFHFIVARNPGNLRHLGHSVNTDTPITLNPLEIDLKTAGRRAKLGKILIKLSNTATQIRIFFNQKHIIFSDFRGFQGDSQPADASANDQYSTCSRCAVLVCHAIPPFYFG